MRSTATGSPATSDCTRSTMRLTAALSLVGLSVSTQRWTPEIMEARSTARCCGMIYRTTFVRMRRARRAPGNGQRVASECKLKEGQSWEDERMITITRREALALGAGLGAFGFAGRPAGAQQRFFRIGTGGTGGTYYPVGGMIANAISTPTINVSAVATNGAVANVNGIVGGSMESGFSQADVNAWAYTATGIYEGKPKIEELRAIANLYPESVHIVVRKGAGIKSLADLKGKRVSIDEPGSGPLVNARARMASFGVAERDIKPEYLKQVQSAEKL